MNPPVDHAKQLRAFAERCMASDTERAGLRAAADEIDRLKERIAELYRAQKNQILSALSYNADQQ